MCIVCMANNINRNVYMHKYTHFSDYWLRMSAAIRVYKGNGYRMCFFQFTYCDTSTDFIRQSNDTFCTYLRFSATIADINKEET